MLDGIPSSPGEARDTWTLDAVSSGRAEYEFAPVTYEIDGRQAQFNIFRDALKVDGVRINATAIVEQQIADMLGCLLLTPQLADLLFAQRTWTVPPMTSKPDNQMVTTQRMIQHSQRIDDALEKLGYDNTGIVQTAGKHWALVKSYPAGKAANYGWHFLGASNLAYNPATKLTGPGVRVWQSVGKTHYTTHVDYSQTITLVSRRCTIDGEERDLADVLQDATLASLASSEGPLPTVRQPGVPEFETLTTAVPMGGTSEGVSTSDGFPTGKVIVVAFGVGAAAFAGHRLARAR